MQPNNCFADGFLILHATSCPACFPLFYDLPLPAFITYVFTLVGLTVCFSVF